MRIGLGVHGDPRWRGCERMLVVRTPSVYGHVIADGASDSPVSETPDGASRGEICQERLRDRRTATDAARASDRDSTT